MIIWLFGVDITPVEEHSHHFQVPTTGGPRERCITGIHIVLLVDITAFHLRLTKANLGDANNRCLPVVDY